jgi:hypothetical protein
MSERQKKLEGENGENLNPLEPPFTLRQECDRDASLVERQEQGIRSNEVESGVELQHKQN